MPDLSIAVFDVKPHEHCYKEAQLRTISEYSAVTSIASAVDSIAVGKPVVLGMMIFDDFYSLSKTNSTLALPQLPQSIGPSGHAVCIVGYDTEAKTFAIKNSFGTGWGNNGYATVPFEYVDQWAFEMWNFEITTRLP